MRYVLFDKFIILFNGLLPAALLAWDWRHGNLGANKVEAVLHTTGMVSLIFLALTLTVTPVRKLTGWNYLSNFRRMLGLFAFFYALAHFSTYFFFDKGGHFAQVLDDVILRPFILFGMTGLLVMVPLAITSTNGMIKRLGAARWKKLHRLAYVAAGAGAFHFYMFPKADRTRPMIFLGIFALLFAYRVFADHIPAFRRRKPAAIVSANRGA